MSAAIPDESIPGDAAASPPRPQIRQAAGIYGLIVTAAVLATAGTHLRSLPLAIAVFVTLAVYWMAEEYAQIVERASGGHLPTWRRVREGLAAKWPMVSASYVPLLALEGSRLLGAAPPTAAYLALGVTVIVLTAHGLVAGRASGLRGASLVLMTSAAGSLGLLMILLKVLIAHVH